MSRVAQLFTLYPDVQRKQVSSFLQVCLCLAGSPAHWQAGTTTDAKALHSSLGLVGSGDLNRPLGRPGSLVGRFSLGPWCGSGEQNVLPWDCSQWQCLCVPTRIKPDPLGRRLSFSDVSPGFQQTEITNLELAVSPSLKVSR